MKLFQQLGAEIETLWLEQNYNEELFPAIARDALKRYDLPSKLSVWDVIEWSLKQYELPQQRDLHGTFADPPVTIFSGLRFHIDVYFWFEGTAATHQHGFCGAFQVLHGSSIHSWYEFDIHEKLNIYAQIGEMKLKVCELLEVGDVQEIWAGPRYIHGLFHLEQPSATIVVRTDRSPLHLPQLSYYKPNLAVDPFFVQETDIKKLQMMSAAVRAGHPDADRWIGELLDKSDIQTSFKILSQVRMLLKSNQLTQLFKLDGPKERFGRFLDMVAKRHGKAGEVFKPLFERKDILDVIMTLRSYVSHPEHRFFMALLLNVDEMGQIFTLIKQRFPDADPIEKILDWVFDLAETRVVGVDATNALGIPDFGEMEMFVLENLLHGKSDDEIKMAYIAENPNADISGNIAKVRNAVIFRALLS